MSLHETTAVPQLPPEFADQIAEARFVAEVARQSAEDLRFIESGAFFDLLGFCDDAPELPENS